MIKKLDSFFRKAHIVKVFFIYIIISHLINYICSSMEDLGVPNIHFDEILYRKFPFWAELFLSTTFVPLIETFLFQFLPFYILTKSKYLKKNYIIIIVISALLFSLWHNYSIHYMIYGLIEGLIYMYLYFARVGKSPYLTIVAFHALSNLVSSLSNYIFFNIQ